MIENHAGLSYAVEEEQHTYPDATVEPDNVSNVLTCILLELFGFILFLVYKNYEILKFAFSEICSY